MIELPCKDPELPLRFTQPQSKPHTTHATTGGQVERMRELIPSHGDGTHELESLVPATNRAVLLRSWGTGRPIDTGEAATPASW